MPLNKIPKLREPRGPIVQEVRDKFLEEHYKLTPDEFYLQDIKLIEKMDFLLQRFVIMQRKDVDASVKMVADVLRWRKQRRLHDLCDTYFPQELTSSGAVFVYEPDMFGNRTIYMRACMGKNCAELRPAMKDFLAYLMMQIDDPIDGKCFAMIIDLTKTSWSNADLEMLSFLLALLKEYFPVNLDYVLAINFPWILSTAWSLVKHLIPSEKRGAVQFINSNQINDFIAKENCPDFLGGTCQRPYRLEVEGAPTAIDFLINVTRSEIQYKRLKEILAQFKDILSESQFALLQKQAELYKNGQYIRPKSVQATDALMSDYGVAIDSNGNDGNVQDLNQTSKKKEKIIKA